MQYTLVQHSAAAFKGDTTFANAVEELSISPSQARVVQQVRGLLFDDYNAAYNAAMKENYPEGVSGLVPRAAGTFSPKTIDRQRIYVPALKAGRS